MSELCRFHGIIIRIYNNEHGPPHFHAVSGGRQVLIEIQTLRVYSGDLPPAQQRLVLRWARLRQAELIRAWRLAQEHRPMGKISPLE